jgi:hypothetical protein
VSYPTEHYIDIAADPSATLDWLKHYGYWATVTSSTGFPAAVLFTRAWGEPICYMAMVGETLIWTGEKVAVRT